MENEDEKIRRSITAYGANAAVWAVLMILTALTLALSSLDIAAIPMAIATLKALIVAMFFMHLFYEKAFFKLMAGITLAVLLSVAAFVFSDIAFR